MQFEIKGLLLRIDPLASRGDCTKPCTLPYSSCETGTIHTHDLDRVLSDASRADLRKLHDALTTMQQHLESHIHADP